MERCLITLDEMGITRPDETSARWHFW